MNSLTTAGELEPFVAEESVDGRYRLIDLLDRTAACDTWRARDMRLSRDVVIELFYAPGEPVLSCDQLQAALVVRYPHLRRVYDAGSHPRPGGSCTFVITSLRNDAPPLPVGHWQAPGGTHRAPRTSRFRKSAATSDWR